MIPVRVVFLPPFHPPTPSFSLPLTSLFLEGGELRREEECWVGGGGGGLQASRDACFLLSGPKWNLDKNTPLVAACPWLRTCVVT